MPWQKHGAHSRRDLYIALNGVDLTPSREPRRLNARKLLVCSPVPSKRIDGITQLGPLYDKPRICKQLVIRTMIPVQMRIHHGLDIAELHADPAQSLSDPLTGFRRQSIPMQLPGQLDILRTCIDQDRRLATLDQKRKHFRVISLTPSTHVRNSRLRLTNQPPNTQRTNRKAHHTPFHWNSPNTTNISSPGRNPPRRPRASGSASFRFISELTSLRSAKVGLDQSAASHVKRFDLLVGDDLSTGQHVDAFAHTQGQIHALFDHQQ